MRARILHSYKIAPEGHTVITLQPGTIVRGAMAAQAIADGAAVLDELETKPAAALETKPARKVSRKAKATPADDDDQIEF